MKANRVLDVVAAMGLLAVTTWAAEPQLTIYNQNFAVVRVMIPLDLKAGRSRVQFTDTTAYLEPDSVILRDPTGVRTLKILEQNYRADPVSEQLLLSLNEGKTLDFLVQQGDKTEIVQGKIIRSKYLPPFQQFSPYGNPYYPGQGYPPTVQEPIIEVGGKVRFGLPGKPLFPALADDTILKPTLNWILETDKPGGMNAEFSYVTWGMNWVADYSLVAAEEGDVIEVIGWVTIHNQSGKDFENARIKLMAGDVSKLQQQQGPLNG